MDYSGILLSDEQIDRYYNELSDFGAFNVPNQIASNLALIDDNLEIIRDEFDSMNSNMIEAEKEALVELMKKVKEDESHIDNFVDKATVKIEELKRMLQEFEILKPNVREDHSEYKTKAANEDSARLEELRKNISSKIDEIKKTSQGTIVYNTNGVVVNQINQNNVEEENTVSIDNIDQIGYKDN